MMHNYPQFAGMGFGWPAIVLTFLVLAIGLVGLAAWWPSRPHGGDDTRAERILDERLAQGEIDPEEYEQRLRSLHAAHR